jgi:hypothetical protein
MRLEDIDFNRLQVFPYAFAWQTGVQKRFLYTDNKFFYKIWSKNYFINKLIIHGNKYQALTSSDSFHIATVAVGLVNKSICPALVDVIIDDTNICRGYVTLKGQIVNANEAISDAYIKRVFLSTISSGYVFSDFKAQNIINVNGELSVIDLDSPPSLLSNLDLEFQKTDGFLRKGLSTCYSGLVLSYFSENYESLAKTTNARHDSYKA